MFARSQRPFRERILVVLQLGRSLAARQRSFGSSVGPRQEERASTLAFEL